VSFSRPFLPVKIHKQKKPLWILVQVVPVAQLRAQGFATGIANKQLLLPRGGGLTQYKELYIGLASKAGGNLGYGRQQGNKVDYPCWKTLIFKASFSRRKAWLSLLIGLLCFFLFPSGPWKGRAKQGSAEIKAESGRGNLAGQVICESFVFFLDRQRSADSRCSNQ